MGTPHVDSSENSEGKSLKTTDSKAESKTASDAYLEKGDEKWLKDQKASETRLTGAHEKPFALTDCGPCQVKRPAADLPELLRKVPGLSDTALPGMDKGHTVYEMQRSRQDTNTDGSTTDHYSGKLNDGLTRFTCTGVEVDVTSKDGDFTAAHLKYSSEIGPVTIADGEGGLVKLPRLSEVEIRKSAPGDNYDVTFRPNCSFGNRPCNGFSVVDGVMTPTFDPSH